MTPHADIKRAVEAVTARAKALEPPYEERIDALRAYKGKLLDAKRSGLSARQIHEELTKNVSFHITYKAVLAVLHEAEQELDGAAPKDGMGQAGSTKIVSKKNHPRPK